MNTLSPPVASNSSVAAAPQHYDRVQRSFHWGMAAIILIAIAFGIYASYLPPGTPLRRSLLDIHKSLGLTAFALIGFRIVYRVVTRTPPYAEALGRMTHAAAHSAHLALYALMLFMPLTGYLSSGAGGYSLPWFGLFQWPRLVPLDKGLSHTTEGLHQYGADALYVVLATHILAVGWHRLVLRDGVLARMWPSR